MKGTTVTDAEFEQTKTYLTVKYGHLIFALRKLNNTPKEELGDDFEMMDAFFREMFGRIRRRTVDNGK